MARVIAVDIGASSYRVIEGLYANGSFKMNVLARYKHGPLKQKDGHYHWDVLSIKENVVKTIRQAASSGEPILSIGFDSFGTDFGLLDENLQLLDLPIAYRDYMSDGMVEKYFANERDLYYKIGGSIVASTTASIMKGMIEKGYLPIRKAKHMLFIPDLMGYLLTDKMTCESTIATTSRLLDIRTQEWDVDLIKSLGIPSSIFHKLTEAGTVLGKLKREISDGIKNLENTVVVSVAGHDTASAVSIIPQCEHCSFISSGTWSVKGIVSDKAYTGELAGQYRMCNEGQPGKKIRLLRNITGLWLLEECMKDWKNRGKEIEVSELAKAAKVSEPFPSMIFPDASDFTKQGDMPRKIQDYCKKTSQRIPETPIEFMQTIVNGLANEYRRSNEELEVVTGKAINTIYIVGGGSKNELLNQQTADITNCKVIAGHPEATAMGNIMIQLLTDQVIEDQDMFLEAIFGDVPEKIYLPHHTEELNEQYQKYLDLINISE